MKRFIKTVAPVMGAALLAVAALTGCSGPTSQPPSTPASATSYAYPPDGNYPAPANGKVMLVVSFGTSYDNNRDLSIGGVEAALQQAYPDYQIRRAFTSQIIIDILNGRGTHIDNVQQAMDKIVAAGVKDLVVQPSDLMAGFEYTDLVTEANTYASKFEQFAIGAPIFTTDDDFQTLIKAVTTRTASYADGQTAVIFMGHGTDAPSNADYAKMGDMLQADGYTDYFVGTVEGTPTLDDTIAAVKASGKYKKVLLQALMVVAGDHANNDMAGEAETSWKSQFTAAGFSVDTLIEGLGQNPGVQQIYISHAKAAITQSLSFDPSTASPAPTTGNAPLVAAKQLAGGTYPINATTRSSMFKIVDAQLTVQNGSKPAMFATITLSGSGFGRLMLGTAGQATQATTGFIDFTTDDQGRHVYQVPVSRLNQPMAIAAESGKTEGKWYDQTATFLSDQIPADAILDKSDPDAPSTDG